MEFQPHFDYKPETQPLDGLQTGKEIFKEDNPEEFIFPRYDEKNPQACPCPLYGLAMEKTDLSFPLTEAPDLSSPQAWPLYGLAMKKADLPFPLTEAPDLPLDKKTDNPAQMPNIDEMSDEELIELLKKILAKLSQNE